MGTVKNSVDRIAIGKRLRLARRYRRMSQSALAELTSICIDDISRYECGRRIPNAFKLVRLADILEVPVDWILGRIK